MSLTLLRLWSRSSLRLIFRKQLTGRKMAPFDRRFVGRPAAGVGATLNPAPQAAAPAVVVHPAVALSPTLVRATNVATVDPAAFQRMRYPGFRPIWNRGVPRSSLALPTLVSA